MATDDARAGSARGPREWRLRARPALSLRVSLPPRSPSLPAIALLALAALLPWSGPLAAPTLAARLAEAQEQRGAEASARGDFAGALAAWEQAARLRHELPDPAGEARIAGTIAMAYYERQDYAAAAQRFASFLGMTRGLGERPATAVALTYLGNSLLFAHHYGPSAAALREALPLQRELHDRVGEGVVLSGLATAELQRGAWADARSAFGQLERLGRELHDDRLLAFALLGLGQVADRLGTPDGARVRFEQALQLARRVRDRRTEGRALGGLGHVRLSLGDLAGARELYERSLAIARESADREGESDALGNLGNALVLAGARREATRAFDESLRIARERGDRQAESDALIGVGLAAERGGERPAAIAAYERAAQAARASANAPAAVIALTNLGGAYRDAARPADAERVLREAARTADGLRETDLGDMDRVRYFETQLLTYRQLRDLLIAQGRADAALEFAEQGRAQALRLQLARRAAAADEAAMPVPAAPDAAQLRTFAADRSLTLVEYATDVRGRELLAWVVAPDGRVALRRTPLPAPLRELVGAARRELQVDELDRSARARGLRVVAAPAAGAAPAADPMRRLHALLIEPLQELLPADPQQVVAIVPDAELYLVPFAALADRGGRPLVERHALVTAPSLAVLALARRRSPGPTAPAPASAGAVPVTHTAPAAPAAAAALVIGNPLMPAIRVAGEPAPVRLPPLPGTEREAREIAQLAGTRALLGRDATRAALERRIGGARWVHLATHGLLEDFGAGIPGAIALAPAADDDGLLTAAAIARLHLTADLVVLSACDTGRGTVTADGVVGLSRSLLVAGAATTLVSLWQVPDEATAFLMIEFYRRLLAGDDKARALRAAMLATRERFPAAANWSGFVLVGAET